MGGDGEQATRLDRRIDRTLAVVFIAIALAVAALVVCALHAPAASAGPGTAPAPGVSASDVATPAADPPPSYVLQPPSKGAYLGIFRPPAPFKPSAISQYKSLSGKPASLVMWFVPWVSAGKYVPFQAAQARAVWSRGAMPIVVWEPWSPGSTPHALKNPANAPAWKLSNIANGQYDAYIAQYARDVKAAGGPVGISLFHEMNGVWYPWGGGANGNTPADEVAAYRHVHDIFVQQGATNVTWIWSVNFQSRPTDYAHRWAAYYPGDQYVDWVAVSGFNWGQGVGGGPWKSFEKIYRLPLRYLRTLHKPVMISEVASVENGGNKPAWLTDAFRRIRCGHPEVKAVVYYDAIEHSHNRVQDWRMNSSKRSQKSYRKAVASRYFVGGAPAALTAWRNAGR